MHDNTHTQAAGTGYCETCGQLIAPPPAYGTGPSTSKRVGIAISILLHVLVVVYYLLRPAPVRPIPPPMKESAMVYIAPLADKPPAAPVSKPAPEPKPKPVPKPEVAKVKPPPRQKPALASVAPVKRPKQEVFVPPAVSPMRAPPPAQVAPATDMSEMIAQRQKARADSQPQPPAEESENDRAMRVARANIAGAQGRNTGADREDSGGVFSIVNQTSFSAEVKFRGWNGNFKRNWLKQERVEIGGERDIENAIVKKMIALIRNEKPGDFVWESRRLGRNVNLSAKVEHEAELREFLLQEFFPSYRRSR